MINDIAQHAYLVTQAAKNGDALFKKLVWEGTLVTIDEWVNIDEAIKPSFEFGTNAPLYNNGMITYKSKSWSITACRIGEKLFTIYFDSTPEIQFAYAPRAKPGDDITSIFKSASLGFNARVPYTSVVKIFSIMMGAIIKYLQERDPEALIFTGMDESLHSLYSKIILAAPTTAALSEIGFEAREVKDVFIVAKQV